MKKMWFRSAALLVALSRSFMKLSLLYALTLFGFCIASCSNSSSTVNNPPGGGTNLIVPATVIPKIGSTFAYAVFGVDTNGVRGKDTSSIITDSVVEVGIGYQGRNNVVHLRYSVSPGYFKDHYVNYESNGDISFYRDDNSLFQINMTETGWYTYPVQSQVMQPYLVMDTNIISSGDTNHKHIEDTIRYGAASRDTVGGSPLVIASCNNVGVGNWYNNGAFTMRVIDTTSLSFAPAIGYPTDVKTHPARYSLGYAEQEWEYVLLKYTLK